VHLVETYTYAYHSLLFLQHLASKPAYYKPIPEFHLTNVGRPSTTPNPCLNYEAYGRSKVDLLRAMKEHRKEVWQEKQKMDKKREKGVLDCIIAKETRREVMYQHRMLQERQSKLIQHVMLIARTRALGPVLIEGRKKRQIDR
jgi:hypothetical protein